MVDYLDHLGGADTVYRLTLLVMIDEDHLLTRDIQKISLRDHADIFVIRVKDREVPDALFRHGRLDLRDQIFFGEGHKRFVHDMTDRDRLIDEL